jgi:hypothetical protein
MTESESKESSREELEEMEKQRESQETEGQHVTLLSKLVSRKPRQNPPPTQREHSESADSQQIPRNKDMMQAGGSKKHKSYMVA